MHVRILKVEFLVGKIAGIQELIFETDYNRKG